MSTTTTTTIIDKLLCFKKLVVGVLPFSAPTGGQQACRLFLHVLPGMYVMRAGVLLLVVNIGKYCEVMVTVVVVEV